MKKVKHIKDIQHEKLRLRVLQLEQEKAMRQSWSELRNDLKPGNLLRNQLAAVTHTQPEKGQLLSGLLNYGVSYLSRRFSGMAGEKIENTLQRVIQTFTEKRKSRKSRKS